MKVRIHTYQVQRVAYDVEVGSTEEAEQAARQWYDEGKALGWPVAAEMCDEAMPYVLLDPLLENGDVDYAASRWVDIED